MKIFNSILLVIVVLSFGFPEIASAATNINSTNKWAWNDSFGWMNFFSPGTVNITPSLIQGYAVWESFAGSYIAFDCATSPNGNICSTSNFNVTNDGAGNLAGWGWNDAVGWISFNCNNSVIGNTCATSDYRVLLNTTTGDFSGWGWNDALGWISFNCSNTSTCGTVSYKVSQNISGPVAGNLISSTFDTGYSNGVSFNSFLWQGSLPTDSAVKFQLATANCSNGATDAPGCAAGVGWGGSKTAGDGAFLGSDGSSATYYSPSGPNSPIQIAGIYHNNKRYYRYKVFLDGIYTLPSTGIDSVNKWAWNDSFGWMNFFSPGTVNITPSLIQGYAVWESFAGSYIAFDCATSPNGNICSTSNFNVTNDGAGNLAGWGWNDAVGWISFNCNNSVIGNTCATSDYRVLLNTTTGDFSGWGWNDALGWISFNCSNTSTCGTVSYKVMQVASSSSGLPVVDDVIVNWSP